ncbi:hypothetical protein SPBRAN_1030 [uncultured Candidatus Thioglobus sp.]|nr:hypothetical protein SPBRAN_1030 [uncultured Candidatus Thioglobus sp.]
MIVKMTDFSKLGFLLKPVPASLQQVLIKSLSWRKVETAVKKARLYGNKTAVK